MVCELSSIASHASLQLRVICAARQYPSLLDISALTAADRSAAGGQRAEKWDSYQVFILNDTAEFRPKADYSHWMAESFFRRWKELTQAGVELGDRIYLPINW